MVHDNRIYGNGTFVAEPATIVYLSSLTLLVVFGLFGNILIFCVMRHRDQPRFSYSVYFKVAAVSDSLVLLMTLTEDFLDRATGVSVPRFLGLSIHLCRLWMILGSLARTLSPYIMVAVAADRCLALWFPFKRSKYCSKKSARGFVFWFTVVVLTIYSMVLMRGLNILEDEREGVVCHFHEDEDVVLGMIHLMTVTVLPCLLLLIVNLLVIYKIHQSLRPVCTSETKYLARAAGPVILVSCLAFITLLPISATEVYEVVRFGSPKDLGLNPGMANSSRHSLKNIRGHVESENDMNNQNDWRHHTDNRTDHQVESDEVHDEFKRGRGRENSDYEDYDRLYDHRETIERVWDACNFIYLINFSQNLYVLILGSKHDRHIFVRIFDKRRSLRYSNGEHASESTMKVSVCDNSKVTGV